MVCRACNNNNISYGSESYTKGVVCAMCRDNLFPKHIPKEQEAKYFISRRFENE